ncbi:MAG TPA: acetylxylan esterase [Bacteroidales bacterium]|nr:acetylxylan esterase [Bacteroidales bacterium]
MKALFLFLALNCSFLVRGLAQNLLSPVWKIGFDNLPENTKGTINTANWKEVNLLLSWERQGYYSDYGRGCIVNEFLVPEGLSASKFVLSIGLQCDIEKILINGKVIGVNLPNQFWTNRGAKKEFDIPEGCLLSGKPNQMVVYVTNLSYTGGISVNSCSIAPKGATNNSCVKIEISAKDHMYDVAKENAFAINYTATAKGKVKLSVISDFHQVIVQNEYEVEKGSGTIRFDFKDHITTPGFYECIAMMNDGGYTSDVQWLTLAPEKIGCDNHTVLGFKAYWDQALTELKSIQPEFKLTKEDRLCSATRDGYIAEMKSLGGLTIRGYYFVPKTAGKHAAILHVPGYGEGYQDPGVFLATSDDVVELALCVRGHGISADVFNPGFGIPGIWGYKLCSEKEVAYRGIYMDCVRAVEFLLNRPEVDASRIGVMGGSQGGGLTLAVAGMCSDKIKACAFFDPFPCDTRHHLKIRTMCNREIQNFLGFYHNECSFEDALKIQDLMDTKGFASWIKCPAFFVTSLFDDDAPSHMGFSAYNSIQSPKSFKIYPNLGHLNYKARGVQMEFMKKELGF